MEQQKKPFSDIVTFELTAKARELVEKNAKYANMKKQLEKYKQQRNLIGVINTQKMMDAALEEVVWRLAEQEVEKRKNTSEILKMLPEEEQSRYRDYLNVLSFCFDTIDYAITDVNDLWKRNGIKFNAESIPEVKRCKDKVASILNEEMHNMNDKELDEYFNEADNVYAYLIKRSGVFRRKVDKLKAKEEKCAQNA